MASTTVFFTALKAGYKLDAQSSANIRVSQDDTEMMVNWEITGSGIKNLKVINKPAEIPIAPLTKMIIKA